MRFPGAVGLGWQATLLLAFAAGHRVRFPAEMSPIIPKQSMIQTKETGRSQPCEREEAC